MKATTQSLTAPFMNFALCFVLFCFLWSVNINYCQLIRASQGYFDAYYDFFATRVRQVDGSVGVFLGMSICANAALPASIRAPAMSVTVEN